MTETEVRRSNIRFILSKVRGLDKAARQDVYRKIAMGPFWAPIMAIQSLAYDPSSYPHCIELEPK